MKIIYTDYAEAALRERQINKRDIEKVLLVPEETLEGDKERKIAQRIINTKLLRVVYEFETNTYIVITAYLTEPRRYRKNENPF